MCGLLSAPPLMNRLIQAGLAGIFPVLVASCASSGPSGFELADVDDDQKITLRELSDHVTVQVFKEGDLDCDGYLSFGEWRKLAPELDPSVFKDRDRNGDGRISLEEGIAFTREKKTFYPMFEGLDDDGDSVISAAEARQFLEDAARKQEGSNS